MILHMKQTTITGIAKPVFDTIIGEYIISDAIKNNMYAVSGKNNKVKKRLISVGIIKECKIIHYFVRLGIPLNSIPSTVCVTVGGYF